MLSYGLKNCNEQQSELITFVSEKQCLNRSFVEMQVEKKKKSVS